MAPVAAGERPVRVDHAGLRAEEERHAIKARPRVKAAARARTPARAPGGRETPPRATGTPRSPWRRPRRHVPGGACSADSRSRLERARDLLVGQQVLVPLAAQEVPLEVAHDPRERPLERLAVPRRVLELVLVGDAPAHLERHERGAVQEVPERLLVALGVEVEEDREPADLPVHLEQHVLQRAQLARPAVDHEPGRSRRVLRPVVGQALGLAPDLGDERVDREHVGDGARHRCEAGGAFEDRDEPEHVRARGDVAEADRRQRGAAEVDRLEEAVGGEVRVRGVGEAVVHEGQVDQREAEPQAGEPGEERPGHHRERRRVGEQRLRVDPTRDRAREAPDLALRPPRDEAAPGRVEDRHHQVPQQQEDQQRADDGEEDVHEAEQRARRTLVRVP